MGHERLALHMLKAGANANATDNNGWPLIVLATACGHVALVDAMIEAKVDVNAKNSV
jgi:ankyrin repeat protein